MNNGPELWRTILSRFPEGAIIAGGAVRDYLLKVPPKDIDVFLPASAGAPVEYGISDPRFGLGRIDAIHERKAEYEAMTGVQLVSRGVIDGWTVDLVELGFDFDGEQLVKTFDFGINRCWFDGQNTCFLFSCDDDLRNHTVTLLDDSRLSRSKRRFKQFNERHGGDWQFVSGLAHEVNLHD